MSEDFETRNYSQFPVSQNPPTYFTYFLLRRLTTYYFLQHLLKSYLPTYFLYILPLVCSRFQARIIAFYDDMIPEQSAVGIAMHVMLLIRFNST